MNHLMTPPLPPPPASSHVDILTRAGEETAKERGLHTFISTPSGFLLMNSVKNVPVL